MYTNGINITEVHNKLFGRIGWEQSTSTTAPVLSSTVTDSASGRFFNDFHPLVTAENVKYTQDDSGISDDDLSTLLEKRTKAAITASLVNVYEDNQVIESIKVYERVGQNDKLIENTGLFVGYEINIANTYSKKTQIQACELYFDGEVEFNLYLFKDGDTEPLKTIPVTSVTNRLTKITLEDVYLSYDGVSKYYFGYFQNDLGTVKAYQENVYSKERSFCFRVDSIYSASNGMEFNRENVSYTYEPYGINLELISFNDITQVVLNNPTMFDNAIGLNVAIWALELMLNNTRSNKNERITKEQVGVIYRDLNQVTTAENPFNAGLKKQLQNEYKRLRNLIKPKAKAEVKSYEHN